MAEPVKKDDALAAAVREAFQRHMENARLASLSNKPVTPPAEVKRPVLATATVRQLELRAEPQPKAPDPVRSDVVAKRFEEPRLPSVDNSPLPALPTIDIVDSRQHRNSAERRDSPSVEPKSVDVLPRAPKDARPGQRPASGDAPASARPAVPLAPPPPANDRPARIAADRMREREPKAPQQVEGFEALEERPADAKANRAVIAPPTPRPRVSQRRDAANGNQGVHFGTGSRREVQQRSSSRWIVLAALGAASLLCIGIGGYVWISASAPSSKAGAVEGRDTTSAQPATKTALAPAPGAKIAAAPAPTSAPVQKIVSSLPGASEQDSAAPKSDASRPESPVAARTVQTTTITLDAIDLAVQDARERMGTGDVAAARLILERFREGGDPRALFALAETYDPAMVRDATLADPKQAQELYEAAGRAGFAASADRLARLQLEKQ